MATVYLARDEKHHRHVALKVLDPELGAVLGAERFLSEIRVTAGLQHPNLLPLFDSGEVGGLLYYVMPYIEGETLRHRIEREKQLPVDEAVRIAIAVANALDYAHGHGVIHRDLKPENILLQHGQPVVADFGIALAVSNAGGARITQTGLSLGTPQYMSPEQATGDRVIDGRTDVYSLAAVTYEMLTGEAPHSGPSAQAIIAKLMTTAPQPVRALRPSVPPHVAMAVEHGLQKLPADRFATAKAFADALTNPSFTTGTATITPAASPSPRLSGAIWGLGALCALSIAAALWGWLRPSESKPVLRYTLVPDSSEALITTARWGRIALSPDGSILVYVGGPRNALMVRRRDELTAQPLGGTDNAGAPAFSPDGRRIAFIQPTLSPDGKWLAYAIAGNEISGIYVSPFPNVASAKWLVSPDGGSEPVWSNSGRELFYRRSGAVVSVSVSTTPTFSFGMPKTLFPATATGRFALAPDDSRFLMVRRFGRPGAASRDRLTIIENWAQDLSRRARP
jgi:serine/threonine-protein kinase